MMEEHKLNAKKDKNKKETSALRNNMYKGSMAGSKQTGTCQCDKKLLY